MVFFDTYKKNGHVGIYVGNGKFIGSQSATGVAIARMDTGYFKKKFSGVVRRVGDKHKTIKQGNAEWAKSNSYDNMWKTKKYSSSKNYKTFTGHLNEAMTKGVPKSWASAMAELVGRESTWNPNAKNPTSTAHGYAQFLNSTVKHYKKKHPNLNYSNPVHQLIFMYHYVKDRYGTPEKALKFWDKNKWY